VACQKPRHSTAFSSNGLSLFRNRALLRQRNRSYGSGQPYVFSGQDPSEAAANCADPSTLRSPSRHRSMSDFSESMLMRRSMSIGTIRAALAHSTVADSDRPVPPSSSGEAMQIGNRAKVDAAHSATRTRAGGPRSHCGIARGWRTAIAGGTVETYSPPEQVYRTVRSRASTASDCTVNPHCLSGPAPFMRGGPDTAKGLTPSGKQQNEHPCTGTDQISLGDY
jgi:hypothetical protein